MPQTLNFKSLIYVNLIFFLNFIVIKKDVLFTNWIIYIYISSIQLNHIT